MAPDTSTFTATVADSPIGPLTLAANQRGLTHLSFGRDEFLMATVETATAEGSPILGRAIEELGEYFAGTRRSFSVPVDPRGTEFQKAAWQALLRAEFGRTMSYSEQAAFVGRPAATRAVGAANGRNPVAIVLPCHRVVGKNGTLTGFAGGLDVKQWLLEHERAVVARGK